jgi:predicted phage terminase large subunit-like protein
VRPGLYLTRTFENFKISTWPEFREWIPWNLVVPSHKHRANPEWIPNQPFQLAFINGAIVICKGLKDADSARGPNINWLWYDESGRDETGEAWQIAVASVRVGEDPQAWTTTTPRGKDHWVYRFFVEQNIPEDAIKAFQELAGDKLLVEYFYTTIDDNKSNLDPGFYAQLLAAYPSGWLRQQELYGEFVDQGGVLGDRAWFDGKIVPYAPDGVRGRVRYWDLAASEKKVAGTKTNDPDETCGTKMSFVHDKESKHNTFFIEDQVSGFYQWDDIKRIIFETAIKDGPGVKIVCEQEPGSGGINQVAQIATEVKQLLPAWPSVELHNPRDLGDKIMRANTWFAEAAQGEVFLVAGTWVEGFLNQLASFPVGRHDDKIDSISGARHVIAPVKKWKWIQFMRV